VHGASLRQGVFFRRAAGWLKPGGRVAICAWLARFIDPAQAIFLEKFATLLEAVRSGAMHYGCIVARRP